MKQLSLPELDNTLSIEARIGLTPWAYTSAVKPPMVGWYQTRSRLRPSNIARRWWNGSYWSAAVYIGQTEAEEATNKSHRSMIQGDIEWCGLAARHPDRYPYRLFVTEEKPNGPAAEPESTPVQRRERVKLDE